MKKKNLILVFAFVSLSLVGCGGTTEINNSSVLSFDISDSSSASTSNTDSNSTSNTNSSSIDEFNNVEFSVSLYKGTKLYVPAESENITVTWYNDYNHYESQIGTDGFARIKGLEGTYYVSVSGLQDKYVVAPSLEIVNADNPDLALKIKTIYLPSKGTGEDKFTNVYHISEGRTYRAKFSEKKELYYQFKPENSGIYAIESYVDLFQDVVNPIAYAYTTQAQYLDDTSRVTVDDGGVSLKKKYTKNFYYEFKADSTEIGASFTFAVTADSKNGFPVSVPFSLTYIGEYSIPKTNAVVIYPESIGTKADPIITKDEDTKAKGSWHTSNEKGMQVGANYKYDEEIGYWRRYDASTDTFGPIVCAKITKACPYLEKALYAVQEEGNKALTVSQGTESYEYFIAGNYYVNMFGPHADITPSTYNGISYMDVCNSDGVCFLTNELKEFLQKYAISQRLFFDGNGICELGGVDSTQDDQWLFACGWYE